MSSDFLVALPKAELHVHIEGTLEPASLLEAAQRNGVRLPYATVEDVQAAYRFTDLQSFLDIYYAGMSVLQYETDFFDLAEAYFRRAQACGIVHVEFFFDPQAHTLRGVPLEVVLDGLWEASRLSEQRYGISSAMIMCFLRDRPAAEAMATLEAALPFGERIVGVGLDSAERGHPPSKFAEVFARARAEGWHTVAHAGEEGPPAYVVDALDLLHAERIDHGVRSLEDSLLVERLRQSGTPLTICPLSNVKLGVVNRIEDHPLTTMLERGLHVTVNSDDPAYFGGYLDDNFRALQDVLRMERDTCVTLARNSITASFLTPAQQRRHLNAIDAACSEVAGEGA
ncbi:MAG TPA: adenosine deaminase [Candidatus Acidoferrales bacterium]|nr:adenosine deaminase [Candidatus Acidoferrales bacterium]